MEGERVASVGRREENKASKRARLEAAALQAFLAHGYAGASVEQIAAAAGIARGTFYLYFRDKRALFSALIDEFVDPLLATIGRARDELLRCADLAATVPVYAQMGAELSLLLLQNPAAARLALCELRAAGAGGDLVRERGERIEQFTAEILADGARRNFLRGHDSRAVTLAIVGGIERLAWAALRGDPTLDLMRLPQELELLFRRGLSAS